MADILLQDAPPAYQPILRRSLHDEAASRLRDMIIDGRLSPGDRVNEVEAGRMLGVSRTPLREALKTLASEGLIDIVPNRGALVRSFSGADVLDMLEALKVVEQAAGRLACARAPDDDIAAVRSLHATMMERYEARARLDYFKLNQAIHSAIVEISGNATLLWTHETIQARMKRIRFLGNDGESKWGAAVAEHIEMDEALGARDGERLAEVLGRHMDHTWERVRDTLPA